MITAHGEVNIPGIRGHVSAPQRRHPIQEKQGPVLVRQAGHVTGLIHGAGRGLVVHHGDQFVVATGEFRSKSVQVNRRAPGRLEGFAFAAETIDNAYGQVAELTIGNGQGAVAVLENAGDRTFEAAAP